MPLIARPLAGEIRDILPSSDATEAPMGVACDHLPKPTNVQATVALADAAGGAQPMSPNPRAANVLGEALGALPHRSDPTGKQEMRSPGTWLSVPLLLIDGPLPGLVMQSDVSADVGATLQPVRQEEKSNPAGVGCKQVLAPGKSCQGNRVVNEAHGLKNSTCHRASTSVQPPPKKSKTSAHGIVTRAVAAKSVDNAPSACTGKTTAPRKRAPSARVRKPLIKPGS